MSGAPLPMLFDPTCISDVFASGAIDAEEMGDVVRLTFYVSHRSIHDGSPERVVVSRIVMTSEAYAHFRAMVAATGDSTTVKRPTLHFIGGMN